MKTEDIKILKINREKEYFSLQLKDEKENVIFWIDCSLIDGYGNRKNYKTEELYIDWTFNQYIFTIGNSKDDEAKAYQENDENLERIQELLDCFNDEIIKLYKEGAKC